MKGWTPDGREVGLTPRQEALVGALLSRHPALLPARGYGYGWSTILATAARYDSARRSGDPLPEDPGPADPGRFAAVEVLREMADCLNAAGAAESVQEWYGTAVRLSEQGWVSPHCRCVISDADLQAHIQAALEASKGP